MKLSLSTNLAAHLLMQDEHAAWTWAGAYALVEYLEELEDNIGEEVEFCPVALRCDYSQYSDLQEWAKEQWGDIDKASDYLACEGLDEQEFNEEIRDYIRDRGTLLEFSNGVIVSSF